MRGQTIFFILLLLTGCERSEAENETRAIDAIAATSGLPRTKLRAHRRSELGTHAHHFLRVTSPAQPALDTTIVIGDDGLIIAGEPDAFDRIARRERAAARLGSLGALKVSGWFAALDRTCGAPTKGVASARLPDGGVAIAYDFAHTAGRKRCLLELAPDGSLRAARAELIESRKLAHLRTR